MSDAPAPTPPPRCGQVTRLLRAASSGERQAMEGLLPLVYDELMRIARSRMAGERANHTLQATALVHEAYLKLLGDDAGPIDWNDRIHFYRAAAEAMRRILIDHARTRQRAKRGGEKNRVALDQVDIAQESNLEDVLALDGAICRLVERDPRAAEIVRLRYYGGLSVEDTAEALKLSPRTVKREWTFARAWLFDQLHGSK